MRNIERPGQPVRLGELVGEQVHNAQRAGWVDTCEDQDHAAVVGAR